MIFVESPHVVSHVIFCAPCLRHQHEHCMRRIASGGDQEFEHVVKRGGV